MKFPFRKKKPEDIYKERIKKLKKKYSNEHTEEKIIGDALFSTSKELIEDKGYSPENALSIIREKIIIPFNIVEKAWEALKRKIKDIFIEPV